MHIPRLTTLAVWLEAGAPHQDSVDHFDMSRGVAYNACGTTCCIAGAATQFFGGAEGVALRDEAIKGWQTGMTVGDAGESTFYGEGGAFPVAMALLELTNEQACSLFTPNHLDEDEWGSITPEEVARVIRNLIQTGKVDWSEPMKKPHMRYSHMGVIAFTIESDDGDGSDLTPEQYKAALMKRIADLMANPVEWPEAVDLRDTMEQ